MLTKIGRTALQNRSDSKNRTDFGCSCKRGVTLMSILCILDFDTCNYPSIRCKKMKFRYICQVYEVDFSNKLNHLDLESLEFYKFFDICLIRFKTNQILII
jgi:hypothetical protein